MRTLIVDGQVLQSIARHRGMGRYSEYLLGAIIDEEAYESIHVILSKNNPRSIGDVRKDPLLSRVNVEYLDIYDSGLHPVEGAEQHNKEILNSFIKTLNGNDNARAVDFLILAAFQEPLVSVFPDNVGKHLIFYDLIPYLYHEQYIHKMPFDKYLRHYRLVFEADKLLAISDAVGDDIEVYLGVHSKHIAAIHGAAVRSSGQPTRPTGIALPGPFILMPTGDDPRKNNYMAVRGFELFNSAQNGAYKLVVTSDMHYAEKAKLEKLSKDLIFTGNIDEAELDWLYSKAASVLFVSESEGLGLPILEAVSAGAKVVSSNLGVFKEISETAFFYCDQTDEHSIARALGEATSTHLKKSQKNEYARILKFYTWQQTAKRAIEAMHHVAPSLSVAKKKIAVFTPRPDGISAIGKVIAETHASLLERFDVDYYIENGSAVVNTRPNYLQYVANCYPASSFSIESYKEYDAVFYHIGNSDYHLQSIANSLYLPGYVVIHDTNISSAYNEMMEQGMISRERVALEAEITKVGKLKLSNHIASVVTNQLGVLSHSKYANSAVIEASKAHKVASFNINLPTRAPQRMPVRTYEQLHFGLAGIIADIKGTAVIESLAREPRYLAHQFHLFGYNYSQPETMKRLQSYPNVSVTTNITDFEFVQQMRRLDVFVNYRMQYQGETSLSTLEAMRQGVVVIVRDIGWYAELPDDAVIKVSDFADISAVIAGLVKDRDQLRTISKRAVEYIRKEYGHEAYAEGMDMMLTKSKEKREAFLTVLSDDKIKTASDILKARSL